MVTYFVKGGIMMWPLLFLSIFSLAIIIERIVFYVVCAHRHSRLYNETKKVLSNGDINAATHLANKIKCPLSNVMNIVFENYLQGKERITEFAKESITHETLTIERYLPLLGTIATISTLLGFTGTVLGMINAFESIAIHGISSPAIVASGISEALITTAFGLMIAIPSAAFYYYFSYKSDKMISQMERMIFEIINSL